MGGAVLLRGVTTREVPKVVDGENMLFGGVEPGEILNIFPKNFPGAI